MFFRSYRYTSSDSCSSSVKTQSLRWVYEIRTCSFSNVILDFHSTLVFVTFSYQCYFTHLPMLCYPGMLSTMNLSSGNSEKKEIDTSDTQLVRFMLYLRIWLTTSQLISKHFSLSFFIVSRLTASFLFWCLCGQVNIMPSLLIMLVIRFHLFHWFFWDICTNCWKYDL